MSTKEQTGLVILKSAVVPTTPERAFEVFTTEMASWWPLHSHSIGAGVGGKGTPPDTVVFETGLNGRVYERSASGEEAHWANIAAWDPPNRFVLEWKVNPDAIAATEVEVRFKPEGDGTRVELEHRGFERLGDAAEEGHKSYSEGWPTVFQDYVDTVSK